MCAAARKAHTQRCSSRVDLPYAPPADTVHECFSGLDGAATRVLQCSGTTQDVERSVATIVFTSDSSPSDLAPFPVGVATCQPDSYVYLTRTRKSKSEVTLSWLNADGATLGFHSTTTDPIVSGEGAAAGTCDAAVAMGGVKLSGDLGTQADPPLTATATTAQDWAADKPNVAVAWTEGACSISPPCTLTCAAAH